MKKTWKVLACVAGGAVVAVGSLVLADRYLGKNYLGTPTGKVVGRCRKDGKWFLYVKRFNQISEVEVDAATCMAVSNGDYFNMASEGAVKESRRKARPEEVLNSIPDDDDFAAMILEEETPVCECEGECKGEHLVECDCGDSCDAECQCDCHKE